MGLANEPNPIAISARSRAGRPLRPALEPRKSLPIHVDSSAPILRKIRDMGLYNIAPYFVVMAALCCLFALPIFRFVDSVGGDSGRVVTIDGLRGFLALSVMIYHGLINYNYQANGQ